MTGSRASTPGKASSPSVKKDTGTPSKNKKGLSSMEEGVLSPLHLGSPELSPADLYQFGSDERDRRGSDISGTFGAWALGKTGDDGASKDKFHPPHVGAIESHSFVTRKPGDEEGGKGSFMNFLPYIVVGLAVLSFCLVGGLVPIRLASLSGSILHNIPFAVGCFALGDVLAQLATRDATTTTRTSSLPGPAARGPLADGCDATYSWERTLKAGILGIFINGVVYTFWVLHLDRIIPDESCGVGSWTAVSWLLAKALLDDLTIGPIGNSLGIIGRRLMEGDGLPKALQYWHERIVSVTIADLYFWPAWGVLNFWLVPGVYHAPFTAAGGIIWQIYMSVQSHFGGASGGAGGFARVESKAGGGEVGAFGSAFAGRDEEVSKQAGWCQVVHTGKGSARSLV